MMEMRPVLKPLVKTYVETQIIEFSLGKDLFAIDIQHVREIVEYKRIRPLPNTRAHIRGIIDLRGEITTIIDLALFLSQKSDLPDEKKRIIILDTGDMSQKTGILVDNVHSVLAIDQTMIDSSVHQGYDDSGYIQGIIRMRSADNASAKTELIIWLNIMQILSDT